MMGENEIADIDYGLEYDLEEENTEDYELTTEESASVKSMLKQLNRIEDLEELDSPKV